MPVKVIIQSAGSGPFFRVNGVRRPDSYRFDRNKDRHDLHELTFAKAADFNAISADLLRAPGNPPMHVIVEPETAPTDEALAQEIAELKSAEGAKQAVIDKLKQDLATAEQMLEEASKAPPGLSPEHETFLAERDAFLDLLAPHAKEQETPLQVLERLTKAVATAGAKKAEEAKPKKQNPPAEKPKDPKEGG